MVQLQMWEKFQLRISLHFSKKNMIFRSYVLYVFILFLFDRTYIIYFISKYILYFYNEHLLQILLFKINKISLIKLI